MNSKLTISIRFLYSTQTEQMTDNRKSWTKQDQAIFHIVEEIGTKNWPLVSQLMKEKYQLARRSGKQCRQRWHNQLNPDVNKCQWTEQQEQQLFQAHRKHGNRWIQISKQFHGRTDNSIKNHFYSTIRRSMRRICKILGNRNSTSKLRNIRPSILSQIFQFSKTQQIKCTFKDLNIQISECILQYAKQKPGKSQYFNPQSKDDLQKLVSRLIILNDYYVNLKKKLIKPTFSCKNPTNPIKKRNKNVQKQKQILSDTNSSISHQQCLQGNDQVIIVQQENLNNHLNLENLSKPFQAIWDQIPQISSIQQNIKLQVQTYLDEFLIIKPIKISQMLDSVEYFNQASRQNFIYIEKPSFKEIQNYNEFHEEFDQNQVRIQVFESQNFL